MKIVKEPWTSWCRLCANSCEKSLNFSENSEQAIHFLSCVKKYLSLSLKEEAHLPQHVCSECNSNVYQFEEFAEHCFRVQSMFMELDKHKQSDIDVKSIRLKYLISSSDCTSDFKYQTQEEEKSYEITEIGLDALDISYSDSNDSDGKTLDSGVLEVIVPDKCITNTSSREQENISQSGVQTSQNCIKTASELPVMVVETVYESVTNNEIKSEGNCTSRIGKSSTPQKSSKIVKSKTSFSGQLQSRKRRSKILTGAAKRKSKKPTPAFKELNIDNMLPKGKKNSSTMNADLTVNKSTTTSISFEFVCHVCNTKWKNWNALSRHCKKDHDTSAFVICGCGKKLTTRTSMLEHQMKHSPDSIFKCDHCGKGFYRKSLLNTHLMSHIPKEEQPYVCSQCARRFHCEALLRNHEKVHLPKEKRLLFPCEVCNKMFCSKSAVSTHVKAVHFGQKPFTCNICGNSFASKGILQEHLTVHSEDSPWTCDICNKSFKTKYRLKLHKDIHRETPYSCPHCPMQLSTRRTLRMHLVIHGDVKAYQCPVCGKAFRRSKDLKIHSNLHTGEKPYTCPFCFRTFANGSNCRSHKRRMHPDQLREYEASLAMNHIEIYETVVYDEHPALNDSESSCPASLNQDSKISVTVVTSSEKSLPRPSSCSRTSVIVETSSSDVKSKEIPESTLCQNFTLSNNLLNQQAVPENNFSKDSSCLGKQLFSAVQSVTTFSGNSISH